MNFDFKYQVFPGRQDKKQFCLLGSVKTNIGHTDAASGMASLIKSSMALKYGQLPASLHYLNPNPNIDFADSPFVMNTKLTNIIEEGKPSNALVNSFGVGGTNACVILESAPPLAPTNLAQSPVIVPLSARSKSALTKMKQRLADHLKHHPKTNIADLAYYVICVMPWLVLQVRTNNTWIWTQ